MSGWHAATGRRWVGVVAVWAVAGYSNGAERMVLGEYFTRLG
jgi:hypothetical protein